MVNGNIHVVGVDVRRNSALPEEAIKKSISVVGSSRLVDALLRSGATLDHCEVLPITPLKDALESIGSRIQEGDVTVLASGDPLFFGIGRKLIQLFDQKRVKIYPAPSSVQHTFAEFGIPWDDAAFVSLHGRTPENYIGTILSHHKSVVLTDGNNRPEIIANKIGQFLDDRSKKYSLHVAENLGMESEKIVSGSIDEIAQLSFGNLCCMLVVRNDTQSIRLAGSIGLSEENIIHSRGLITKREVRAAALHALAVEPNSILWDVGAGSGSVGLEAARMSLDTLVFSVEKEEEQQKNILANIAKYDIANMRLIPQSAPTGLYGLPCPNRVFIGGSGGELATIIPICAKQLLPKGRIVVTAVLDKTAKDAPDLLHRAGLTVEMSRIAVERMTYPDQEVTQFNPITIIIGRKI